MTDPAPSPARRRPVLTPEQEEARRLLLRVLHASYGTRGQTGLAALLAEVSERPVTQAQISQWTGGTYALPPWVEEALHEVAERARRRLVERERELRDVARILRDRAAKAARIAARRA